MKKLFFIIYLLAISCSNNKDPDLVDIKSFLNQGEKINLNQKKNTNDKDVGKIYKLSNIKYSNYLNWNQEFQNSKNLIKPSEILIGKRSKSVSMESNSFLIYNDQIISIDKRSKIKILSLDFKTIASKKIYDRNIYKNYNLDFKLIVNKGNIYISDNLGNIHCLNLKTLKIVWKKNYGVPFRSNLKINKNSLFLINSNSKIFSINLDTGNLNWSFETASKKIKDSSSSYQIAIYNDKLFFTNDSSEIYCIDLKSNNIAWSLVFRTDNYQEKPVLFKSSPITVDDSGLLFVSSNYGTTYMIDAKSGFVKWSSPFHFNNRFIVANNYILNTYRDKLVVLNKSNGNVVFNKKIGAEKIRKQLNFKDILIGFERIYLFDTQGYIAVINTKDFNNFNIIKSSNDFHGFSIYKKNLFVRSDNLLVKF